MDDVTSAVSYWVEIADYDLVTAKAMLSTGRYLYVGFMCHQAIEKLLKAYYVHVFGDTPPYIHSLSRLANMTGIDILLTEEQIDCIDTLEPLNIEARYPTDRERLGQSLTHTLCEVLISETEELSQWIKSQLSC